MCGVCARTFILNFRIFFIFFYILPHMTKREKLNFRTKLLFWISNTNPKCNLCIVNLLLYIKLKWILWLKHQFCKEYLFQNFLFQTLICNFKLQFYWKFKRITRDTQFDLTFDIRFKFDSNLQIQISFFLIWFEFNSIYSKIL